MSRRFQFFTTSLCLCLGYFASGNGVGLVIAQEEAAAAPVAEIAPEPAPPIPAPTPESATEQSNKPDQEAEKPVPDAKPDSAPEKNETDSPAAKPDDESVTDDKADKPPKRNTVEPKKLPRLGDIDGPMIPGQPWRVHDRRRPRPAVITPGELSTYDKPGTPPSDAIVLFDGKDLSNWCHISKEDPNQLIEAQWKVEDGYFEVASKAGHLYTVDSFGSCQLHIEWQAPAVVKGDSQGRGNSGIHFMEKFEVQILDSFDNRTYADGQAGAIYGRFPPMVNASRKPGEWQVYEILFQAPEFSLDGELEKPASATVIHNGVFLHNAREYHGPSGGGVQRYEMLSPTAQIRLQDHGSAVRFRNIWVRPISD